jgi:hypothetical protein
VQLVKPRMLHANGRVTVRELQRVRGKGSGGGECQQSESSEESTEMYITCWIGANALFRKEADFRWSSTQKKAKRSNLERRNLLW